MCTCNNEKIYVIGGLAGSIIFILCMIIPMVLSPYSDRKHNPWMVLVIIVGVILGLVVGNIVVYVLMQIKQKLERRFIHVVEII